MQNEILKIDEKTTKVLSNLLKAFEIIKNNELVFKNEGQLIELNRLAVKAINEQLKNLNKCVSNFYEENRDFIFEALKLEIGND